MPKAEAQKIHTLTGHQDAIYALLPSTDSAVFWTAAADGMVVRWDLRNPENGVLVSKTVHSVYALARNESQTKLYIGENFEGIHLVDLDKGQEEKALKITEKAIFALEMLENSLWVGSGEGVVSILEKDHLQIRKQIKFSDQSVRCLAFCPPRREVAIGYSDFKIRIVDIDTFELKQSIEAHQNSVFCLRYTPDYQYLLSGSRDAHLKIWDVNTHYTLHQSIIAHLFTINDIVFSPSGEYFATCSKDKSIKIWKTASFELLKVIDRGRHAGHGTSINRLFWTPYHDYLIACSDDRTISVWEIRFM